MLPLLLLPLTMGNDPEPFRVQNHMPAFEVRNRMPAVAVPDPTQPAPAGYEWQRRQGEDWKLVKVAAAPVVAAVRPFTPSTPFGTSGSSGTPATTALPAGSSPNRARAPGFNAGGGRNAAPTYTIAPRVVSNGFTNGCPPSG